MIHPPSPLLIPHKPANIGYKWLRDNIRFLRLQQHGDNSLKFLKNRVFINESQFRKQWLKYVNIKDPNSNPFFIHCMINMDFLSLSELVEEELKGDKFGGTNQNSDSSEHTGAMASDRLCGLGFSDEDNIIYWGRNFKPHLCMKILVIGIIWRVGIS